LKAKAQPSLVLGIDTGGTYTDGVLLEYETRRVLAAHKSLTTKRDFAIGIENVIEGIQIADPSAIRMVSISTTLATNAIAEGSAQGKRVALLLIGYDPDLIDKFEMGQRFATANYFFFAGGHDLFGREKAPLDLPAILSKVNEIKDQVEAPPAFHQAGLGGTGDDGRPQRLAAGCASRFCHRRAAGHGASPDRRPADGRPR